MRAVFFTPMSAKSVHNLRRCYKERVSQTQVTYRESPVPRKPPMHTEGPSLNTEGPPTAIEGPPLPTEGLPAPREWPPIAIR